MKYYKLKTETDIDKIGRVDGIQATIIGHGDEQSELLMNKKLYDPIRLNKITSFVLDENAILTDVISVGTLSIDGFLVSEKFKEIVSKYILADIQFVDASFINNPNVKGYFFMFFNSNLTNEIDYNETRFGIKEMSLFANKIKINELEKSENNLDALIGLTKKYAGSAKYSIVPVENYNFKSSLKFDVFRLGHFDKSFYFSENVKNEIEKHELSGFNFIESNKLGIKV